MPLVKCRETRKVGQFGGPYKDQERIIEIEESLVTEYHEIVSDDTPIKDWEDK